MNRSITPLVAAGLLLAATAAHADDYAAGLKAKRFQDVERQANAALTVNARDPYALRAKVDALLGMGSDSRLEEATKLAEQCVAANPQQSICHEALGNALGTKALNAGIFSAMGYAADIRDAFRRAIELDPKNLSARFSLEQYYLSAPAIVGGGTGKAKALAAETDKIDPVAANLMLALIDIKNEDVAKGEAALLPMARPASDALADQLRDAWWSLGQFHVQHKNYGDAERVFRALQSRFPESELGPYGLARTLQEQGDNRAALPWFEKAISLEPRSFIYYRMGQALQALSANTKAVAAYGQALALHPALSAKLREDAQAQLKKLKN